MASETEPLSGRFPDSDPAIDPFPEYSATAIVARDATTFPKSEPLGKAPVGKSQQTPRSGRARSRLRERSDGKVAPVRIEDRIIGSSPAIDRLRRQIVQYAPEEASVCIFGESGVGKELVAQELHRLSGRADETFLPINAGAIPETLATAELFGHQKGSFTDAHVSRDGAFLEANGGTLYLDEIGEMSTFIQAQLLRVLDDGKVSRIGSRVAEQVDVRLITATNRNLHKRIAEKAFRGDFYYRITELAVTAPPLRERGDDVIEIAEHLIRHHKNPNYRGAVLTPRAVDRIMSYKFPGNVRELRNLIVRAVVHARGEKILPEHLLFDHDDPVVEAGGAASIADGRDLVSRLIAAKALEQTNGNVTKAAVLADMTRSSFHKIKQEMKTEDYAAVVRQLRARLRAVLDV